MKFFFCERCGKRVTDSELDAGQAADKKLKGVYCKECAGGVSTMEFQPLTREEIARQNSLRERSAEAHAPIVPPASPKPGSQSRRNSTSQARLKPVHGATKAGVTVPGGISQKAAVLWCMAGCVVLVVAVALALRPAPREPSSIVAQPSKVAANPSKTLGQPVETRQQSLPPASKRTAEAGRKTESQDLLAKSKPKVETKSDDRGPTESRPSDAAQSHVTLSGESPAGREEAVEVVVPQIVQRPVAVDSNAKPPATQDGMQPGLVAEYFKDSKFRQLLTRKVDAQIDFIWREPPHKGLPENDYSVRWTGFLVVPAAGEYTFVLNRDNKVRMKLDGRWVLGGEGSFATTRKEMIATGVNLQAGKLALQIEFVKMDGSQCELRWSGPHFGERVPVPAEALVHDPKDKK